ncbi:monooxygenase [Sphingomonas sp. Root710]|uniref:flavin-containing monooxygenase n=1 Tax=Sphingomonas sp. Root710 TaxID=1736594 RepID=UPI0006F2CA3E|nr:NAD(P)/FAD-dependent oxidoreductase [Sphingomonas sp. Root710]KRB85543.1 monooxygenase [Sphingomonas sp. Root710]
MNRTELREANDQVIEDAVLYADPLVLRGLLYQLTGDESLVDVKVDMVDTGFVEVAVATDPADVEMIRKKAADFLKQYRDDGAGDISAGPQSRLHRSLELICGTEIPGNELDLWLEELALDPWARALEWSGPEAPRAASDFMVAVIGAGMGGLGAAVQLKHAGVPFTILEKNAGVGGTWYENRYPGARIDSPSRTYTHIFGAEYEYPYLFCPQEDNEKYFNWVADEFGVRDAIRFNTEVTSVIWDEDAKLWELSAQGPDGPVVVRANAVISAVGFLARPNIPTIAGMEDFAGLAVHSAQWPAGLDISGKRIGVIGSGCTGYQMVPELVRDASHTYLFQRTPNWVFETPGYLSPFPPQVNWLDRNFPYYTNFLRFMIEWNYHPVKMIAALSRDPDFQDEHTLSPLNKKIRDARMAFIQSKLGERPDLVEKMTPPMPPMCARPVLVDKDYSIYDVLLRDDVTLVTDGIDRITPTGIRLEDGSHVDLDIIVFATGYKANDFLWPMEVRGRDGARMQDLWAVDGPRAYLGTMLPGFPNLFMVYGPNTNAVCGLQKVNMEEMVIRFALNCIGGLISQGKHSVDATMDAYWRFNKEVDKAESRRVYSDPRVHNYWRNEHNRSSANNPLDSRLWWQWLRNPAAPPTDGQLPSIDEGLVEARAAVRPWFGHDLVVD